LSRADEWIIVAEQRDGQLHAFPADTDEAWHKTWAWLSRAIEDANDPDRRQSAPDDYVSARVARWMLP
jgi:hypothetical protein